MKDIRTLSEPAQIGQFYLVPHIKIKDSPRRFNKLAYQGMWMPVIGSIHEDPEIAKDLGSHIHPDWRFVPLATIEKLGCYWGAIILEQDIEIKTPVLKRRKMQREFIFPTGLCDTLEPLYLGKKSGCSTCPHRGLPLAGLEPDGDGNVICSGHGLKVHYFSGTIVKR